MRRGCPLRVAESRQGARGGRRSDCCLHQRATWGRSSGWMKPVTRVQKWEFSSRFRRRAFGWRSQPALQRIGLPLWFAHNSHPHGVRLCPTAQRRVLGAPETLSLGPLGARDLAAAVPVVTAAVCWASGRASMIRISVQDHIRAGAATGARVAHPRHRHVLFNAPGKLCRCASLHSPGR
jgi:hypothetical protein